MYFSVLKKKNKKLLPFGWSKMFSLLFILLHSVFKAPQVILAVPLFTQDFATTSFCLKNDISNGILIKIFLKLNGPQRSIYRFEFLHLQSETHRIIDLKPNRKKKNNPKLACPSLTEKYLSQMFAIQFCKTEGKLDKAKQTKNKQTKLFS